MYKKLYYLIVVFLISSCTVTGEKTPDSTVIKETFRENIDYQQINPPQPTQSNANHIEVVEMFFYACPHCYKLDSTIEKWLKNKPEDVDFVRVPAIIGPTWAEQAKAFYVAEKLGIGEQVRKNLFNSIHKDGKQYYNELTLMRFFSEQGVEPERFMPLFQSQEILDLASEARAKTVRYGIRGVPAIIVNGKYYTATYLSLDHNKMMNIVDFLIDKERQALSNSTPTKK